MTSSCRTAEGRQEEGSINSSDMAMTMSRWVMSSSIESSDENNVLKNPLQAADPPTGSLANAWGIIQRGRGGEVQVIGNEEMGIGYEVE